MALSEYESTEETTNLARIARIILGPCTDILRTLLKSKYFAPSDLHREVNCFLLNYPKKKKPPISGEQRDIINGRDYNKFDISLLYVLFRNVCKIQGHKEGWGKEPLLNDNSLSADIEKIRISRNKYYGHITDFFITNDDFKVIWKDLYLTVKSLEKHIGGSKFEKSMQSLKTCQMDPNYELLLIKKLLVLENLVEKVKNLEEKVKVLENAKVPIAVKDVGKWKQDDADFVETHNFPAMFDKVMGQPFVMFVGVPGSGKTATARHIALKLQDEGYDILSIKDIKDTETYCDPQSPQVFVIDDVIGKCRLDMTAYDLINRYKDNLLKPKNSKTKVLLTCREQVFRNQKLSHFFLCSQEKIVLLHSKENALTEEDKCLMLKMHKINENTLSSSDIASTLKMFPLSCKLASTRKTTLSSTLFKSPISCIVDELDKLKIENPLQYASLVLLVANQNKLSSDIFDNENNADRERCFDQRKTECLSKCKVSSFTESSEVMDALLEMEGTYTMNSGGIFTLMHETLFETIAYHFGRDFPNLMLQYMSSDYVAKYIRVEMEDDSEDDYHGYSYDLHIELDESQYQSLAERLYRDVENGEWYSVFGNIALKQDFVLSSFIALMRGKIYDDLHHVFLSEIEEKKRCNEKLLDRDDVGNLSINLINFLYEKGNQRAICWVIYFGHHEILQYLVHRILKRNGCINDIFGKLDSFDNDLEIFETMCEIKRLIALGDSSDNSSICDILKYLLEDSMNTTVYEETEYTLRLPGFFYWRSTKRGITGQT